MRPANYYDHHDHEKWPTYQNTRPQESWNEPFAKKAEEFAEDNKMPNAPSHSLSPELVEAMQLGQHEKIEALLELEKSIEALTTGCLYEVGKHPETGEPYYSGDFRDHPEFEKHFAVLEKAWGDLPEKHPQRRTLEVIRILKEQREHLADISNPNENEFSCETVWRRVDGSDIFMIGFIHTDEYYAYHREIHKKLAKEAGILVIEGHSNLPIGTTLNQRWKTVGLSGLNNYELLMHDATYVNPEILFAEIDPRDWGKVFLESSRDAQDLVPLSPELLMHFFSVLQVMTPHVAINLLSNVQGLYETLRMMASTRKGLWSRALSIKAGGIEYAPMEFANVKNGETRMQPTGFEFGETSWTDAISALKLRQLAKWQQQEDIPAGPILDYEGSAHINGKRVYFDDPIQAGEIIQQNVHLSTQAESLKDQAYLLRSVARNFGEVLSKIKNSFYYQKNPELVKEAELVLQSNDINEIYHFLAVNVSFFQEAIKKYQEINQKMIAEQMFANVFNILNVNRLAKVDYDHLEIGFARPDGQGGLITWRRDWRGDEHVD